MDIRWRIRFFAASAIVSAAFIAGCSSSSDAVLPLFENQASLNQENLSAALPAGQPEPSGSGKDAGSAQAGAPALPGFPENKQVVTSSETGKEPKEKEKEKGKEKGNGSATAFDAKKPALMGLDLSSSRSAVREKFGKPISEYVMEDELDPLSVAEYEGFIVGFDKLQYVAFVEITSKDTDPGLNGLRLGQKGKDAVKALGEPHKHTSTTIVYKGNGTVLKLDLSPKDDTIQSIKLFADRSEN
jgi:hypothetical protein